MNTSDSASNKLADISASTFPPLIASVVPNKKPENVSASIQKEAPKQEVEAPTEKKTITKENESKPVIEKQTSEAKQQKPPAPRKPKFEFFQNNNSVIFLDEIGKPTTNSANSEKDCGQSESLETSNTSRRNNVLNGIKFGFIDSSSSDEDIPTQEEANTETVPAVPVVTESPKPIKNKKYLLKTNSNSSSKSSSSLSLKNSALYSSHRTNSSTTTSSDNDEIEPTQKATRKLKQKSLKGQSKNKLKSTLKKSSDESSQVDKTTSQKAPENQSFYQQQQAPVPHSLPPPPHQYIIYPNQMNAAYLNAYYAAVNHQNNNGNPSYGYPGQIPVGMPNFYQGPHGPMHPHNQIPYNQSKQQIQQSPVVKSENTEQGSISTALSSTSSSDSPFQIKEDPPQKAKETNGSSQSGNSSNSTTPTPSAETSQLNLTETVQPQPQLQQPLVPPQQPVPLIQMNPEFYPPFAPGKL